MADSTVTMTVANVEAPAGVARRPYEIPVVRRKVEVRKVTLFSGSSSGVTGGG